MMIGLLLLEFVVMSPKLLNRHPDLDNIKINPSGVVKQLQKDVE